MNWIRLWHVYLTDQCLNPHTGLYDVPRHEAKRSATSQIIIALFLFVVLAIFACAIFFVGMRESAIMGVALFFPVMAMICLIVARASFEIGRAFERENANKAK